jgi:hypothetical protein
MNRSIYNHAECSMRRIHMVRNGYGAKYIWYEMVSGYGTKLEFCGTKW